MTVATSFVKFDEPHYTPQQLAKLWGVHPNTIRGVFRHEPDVIRIGNAVTTRAKRAYTIMRIPQSVAERVHRRMRQPLASNQRQRA